MLPGSTIIVQSGDAAAAWAAVIGALGASGLTGIITFRMTRRQVTAEDRRWFASQEAVRRTATADRLRIVYARMAQTAFTLQAVISQRSYVTANETKETRDERHDRMVKEAIGSVGITAGQILVESSAKEVRETYELLVSLVQQYFAAEASSPPGTTRAETLSSLIDSINPQVDKLLSFAREQLTELERPVEVGGAIDPPTTREDTDPPTVQGVNPERRWRLQWPLTRS